MCASFASSAKLVTLAARVFSEFSTIANTSPQIGGGRMNPKLAQNIMMKRPRERFSENVGQMRTDRKKRKRDVTRLKLLPNKMAIKLNVFRPLVKDEIFGDVYSSLDIRMKGNG